MSMGFMVVSRAALLCAFCAGGHPSFSLAFQARRVMLRGRHHPHPPAPAGLRVGQGLSLAPTLLCRVGASERLKMIAADSGVGSERLKMIALAERDAPPPALKKPTTLEGQAIPANMEVGCPWRALCFK